MKFTTKPSVPKAMQYQVTAESLHMAQLSVQDAYQQFVETGASCEELFTIVENIAQVTNAVRKHGAQALEVLGTMTEGSLEAFIGSKAMTQTKVAEASLEGKFTEAVKNVWAKIKEWFARLFDWLRMTFVSLDGELKHLSKMVDARNDDKFNPNTEFVNPVPTKDGLMGVLRSVNVGSEQLEKVFPALTKCIQDIDAAAYNAATRKDDKFLSPVDEIGDEIQKQLKTVVAAWEAAANNDPVLKKLIGDIEAVNYADGGVRGNDTIAALIEINSRWVRSGTAADLGYKTGADLRDVVNEFIKTVRVTTRLMPMINKILPVLSTIAANANAVQSGTQRLPDDCIKLIRQFVKIIGTITNTDTKLTRFVLLYVTRAVRRMYA